jgi:DNA-binding transcriptional ArsR family regulator
MQHHPIGSFDWKRIIKRAELHRTTKLIAGFLGDFANADGTDVRPGIELLAKMAGVSDRTVKTHLKALRETGLIEKTKHSRMRGHADVYRLTVPGVDHAPVPMRLDPDYERLDTGMLTATVTSTTTAEPVDNAVDNRLAEPASTDPYVKPGAALSEAGRPSRGNGDHPSIQTNHYQPSTGSPQVGTSLAAASTNGQGEPEARSGFEPDDAEYVAAKEVLEAIPVSDHVSFMTEAIAELAAAGITDPTARQIAARAADFATRPAVPDESRAHGSEALANPRLANGGA